MSNDKEDDLPVEEVPTTVAASPSVEVEPPQPVSNAASTDVVESEPSHTYQRDFGPNAKVELSRPVKTPLKPGTPVGDEDVLSLLGANVDELNALADDYPNLDVGSSEDGARWLSIVQRAQRYILQGKALFTTLEREGSMWRQYVTSGGEQLLAGRPRFGEPVEGGKLVGEQALMKVQSLLGVGSPVRIPLWHTGIWMTLKAPSETALLELDRRISTEKITLGRQTNGLIFSNTSVYTSNYVIDFALAHVLECSLKYDSIEELKQKILITDHPTIALGLAMAIYPNGYAFRQPCLKDPTKCRYVTEELLNISKLIWTDDRALNDWQRRQMVRRSAKFTDEELTRYQEEHQYSKLEAVPLSDELVMELRVPTIEDYATSGFAWVDGIVKQTDQAFSGTLKNEERNRYISDQGHVTTLRQYAHWVKRLVVNGTEVIDDRNTIESLLGTLTASDELSDKFFNAIQSYIDATTISLVAIPKYDCPSCGAPMSDEMQKHPHLIAIDAVEVFFTLLGQRIIKALRRRLS